MFTFKSYDLLIVISHVKVGHFLIMDLYTESQIVGTMLYYDEHSYLYSLWIIQFVQFEIGISLKLIRYILKHSHQF